MSKTKEARKIGRSAITGKFITVKKAQKQKRTSVDETIKKTRKSI